MSEQLPAMTGSTLNQGHVRRANGHAFSHLAMPTRNLGQKFPGFLSLPGKLPQTGRIQRSDAAAPQTSCDEGPRNDLEKHEGANLDSGKSRETALREVKCAFSIVCKMSCSEQTSPHLLLSLKGSRISA